MLLTTTVVLLIYLPLLSVDKLMKVKLEWKGPKVNGREGEADRCNTQPQQAGSLVAWASWPRSTNPGGWGYVKICIFCVASAQIVKRPTGKTPGTPNPTLLVGLAYFLPTRPCPVLCFDLSRCCPHCFDIHTA